MTNQTAPDYTPPTIGEAAESIATQLLIDCSYDDERGDSNLDAEAVSDRLPEYVDASRITFINWEARQALAASLDNDDVMAAAFEDMREFAMFDDVETYDQFACRMAYCLLSRAVRDRILDEAGIAV